MNVSSLMLALISVLQGYGDAGKPIPAKDVQDTIAMMLKASTHVARLEATVEHLEARIADLRRCAKPALTMHQGGKR